MKEKENIKAEEIRLNKFISHNTKYSRREADKIIADGKVVVNKKVVTDLATKVSEDDIVKINDRVIKVEKNKLITVIVYNKQRGELVTKKDPQGRKTIYDSLSSKFKHFIPIGRLDYASEGVLLLTDSVEVADKLMHSNLERVYKLKVNGPITDKVEDAMKTGITLEDATKGARADSKIISMTFAPFNAYQIQTNNHNFSKIKVAISEGKNRELRRFFAHFDLTVMDLKRVDFGGVTLNALPSGKTRYLTREEYKNLRDYVNIDFNESN